MNAEAVAEQLCLKCGICCSGVLFKDVHLQAGDDRDRLTELGLPIKNRSSTEDKGAGTDQPKPVGGRFAQPCCALQPDRTCTLYAERPLRCAQFECLLFGEVRDGKMELPAALRIVKGAHKKADRVRQLFRELNDDNETLALSLRFQRLRGRMEKGPTQDGETLERYGDLTLAVHDLNLLLAGAFYP